MLGIFDGGSLKYIIVVAVVAAAFALGAYLIDNYVDSKLEAQALQSQIEAQEQEEVRVEEQNEIAREEFNVLLSKIESVRKENRKLLDDLKKDWEAQLNEDPHKWIGDTNDATLDQLQRGQALLDRIHSSTSNM